MTGAAIGPAELSVDTDGLTALAARLELLALGWPRTVPCPPGRPAFGDDPVGAELSRSATRFLERSAEGSALAGRLVAACATALERAARELAALDGTAGPPSPAAGAVTVGRRAR